MAQTNLNNNHKLGTFSPFRDMSNGGCYNCYDTTHRERECQNACRICKELFGKIDKSHIRWGCPNKQLYNKKISSNRAGNKNSNRYNNKGDKSKKGDETDKGDKNTALLANVVEQQKQASESTAQLARAVQALTKLIGSAGDAEANYTVVGYSAKAKFEEEAVIDSGANENMEGVRKDHPGKVRGTVGTAGTSLQLLEGSNSRFSRGLNEVVKFKRVRAMRSKPLISANKLTRGGERTVVLTNDKAYLLPSEVIEDLLTEEHVVGYERNGIYQTALNAEKLSPLEMIRRKINVEGKMAEEEMKLSKKMRKLLRQSQKKNKTKTQ
jgi:hypothetical protein